jgi:hypothetical protein
MQHNKPDKVVHDKVKNDIIILEVEITSQDQMQTAEVGKMREYDILAKELGMIYKCTTTIIPYVLPWDGIVTSFHKKYQKQLGVHRYIGAYIQSVVLKRTFVSISLEFRRSGELVSRCRANMVETAVRRLCSEEDKDLQLQNPTV